MATFGYTTVGSTTTTNLVESTMRATRPWSPSSNGTVRSIVAYVELNGGSGGTFHIRPVLYTEAGALVTYGPEVAASGTFSWRTLNVTPASITAGTNYKIGVWFGPERISTVFDADANYSLQRDDETYHATNAPSSTWATASTSTNRKNSIYANYTIDYTMDVTVATFTLTGIDALFPLTRMVTTSVGSFLLVGKDIILTAQRLLNTAVGSFTLTGIDTILAKGFSLAVAVGQFVLTGVDVILRTTVSIFTNKTKNAATFTNKTKNTATFANIEMNTTTFTNKTKNTPTFTNKTKSATTFTNKEKS